MNSDVTRRTKMIQRNKAMKTILSLVVGIAAGVAVLHGYAEEDRDEVISCVGKTNCALSGEARLGNQELDALVRSETSRDIGNAEVKQQRFAKFLAGAKKACKEGLAAVKKSIWNLAKDVKKAQDSGVEAATNVMKDVKKAQDAGVKAGVEVAKALRKDADTAKGATRRTVQELKKDTDAAQVAPIDAAREGDLSR